MGFRMVCGSSTCNGITPYMRIGRSFTVCACRCSSVTFTKILGAILLSILKLYCVWPLRVSIQAVCNTWLPFSILIKARPLSLVGMVRVASSPTLYAVLLEVNESMAASVGLLCWRRSAQFDQSIYSTFPVEWPVCGSFTNSRYRPQSSLLTCRFHCPRPLVNLTVSVLISLL